MAFPGPEVVAPDPPSVIIRDLTRQNGDRRAAPTCKPAAGRGGILGAYPINRFVLARLEQEEIKPSPETNWAKLARRVSLDLTGELPSPEEVRRFENDEASGAYERLVDRLHST